MDPLVDSIIARQRVYEKRAERERPSRFRTRVFNHGRRVVAQVSFVNRSSGFAGPLRLLVLELIRRGMECYKFPQNGGERETGACSLLSRGLDSASHKFSNLFSAT